jgi:hypothetical protein
MSNEDDQKKLYGQFAWILNYKPQIKEQHIHMGNQTAEDKPVGDEAEFEEVKDDQQKEPVKDKEGSEEKLNYKSPTIALQRMLELDWFDKVSTNKGLYSKEWRSKLVADLMASEHRAYIARLWGHEDKRLTIKGQLIGTLVGAGVLSKNKSAVARAYLGISDNTRDADEKKMVNTFGKYIGQWEKEPYAKWVKDYVDKTPKK